MSPEQDKPKSYMQQLDDWIEAYVLGPLLVPGLGDPDEKYEVTVGRVKKAIREKVLESYHNGQAAGPRRKEHYSLRKKA
jgi:hypothetical protein